MKLRHFLPLLLALTCTVPVRADDYEARTFTAADGATLGYRLLAPKTIEPGKNIRSCFSCTALASAGRTMRRSSSIARRFL